MRSAVDGRSRGERDRRGVAADIPDQQGTWRAGSPPMRHGEAESVLLKGPRVMRAPIWDPHQPNILSNIQALYERDHQFAEAGRKGNVVTWIRECKRTIVVVVAVTALYGIVLGLIVILTGIPME